MSTERCPSCGGAVRAGDPWCTLCWTDLRPKPEPPPPPPPPPARAPAPAPVPSYAAALAAVPTPLAPVDPLTAPLGALLGQPLAADPEAPPAVTWPCVECGSANAIDLDACSVCAAPFGGRITRLSDPKAVRRKFLVLSLGAVAVFLMLLALLTFVLTDASTANKDGPTGDPFETTIDYSTLPQG